MIRRPCDQCGTTYTAKLRRSQYCSDRCRKRASRASAPRMLAAVAPAEDSALVVSVRAYLVTRGRESSALGLAALELAAALADQGTRASAKATLAKQLESTLTAATKGTQGAPSALDRIRAERDRKRAAWSDS